MTSDLDCNLIVIVLQEELATLVTLEDADYGDENMRGKLLCSLGEMDKENREAADKYRDDTHEAQRVVIDATTVVDGKRRKRKRKRQTDSEYGICPSSGVLICSLSIKFTTNSSATSKD